MSLASIAMPVAAFVAGSLVPFSLAPFNLWPLMFISAGGLFLILRQPQARPLLTGWLFGLGKYGFGVSWIYISINVHGGATPSLAAFLVFLFISGMALFSAAGAWIFSRLRQTDGFLDPVLFAAIWTLTEWLLTWVLTGFPWLFAGYAMLDTPLENLAPVGGVLLVGFAVVLTAACLTVTRSISSLLIAALPWLACWALAGMGWTNPVRTHSVALVQGNIAQEEKWRPENAETIMDTYAELSNPIWDREVVVWPEAAITLVEHRANTFLDAVASRAQGSLILGIPVVDYSEQGWSSYNGAIAVGDGSGRYLKRRLVPYGEYVPLEGVFRGLIGFFDLPMSKMTAGDRDQPNLRAGELELAISICYEIVYPDLVRLQTREAGAIVTISNDTWFGSSIGPDQHMQMARMRALENGRFLLRATNNGITAIVNERGHEVARLPQFEPGVLTGEFKTHVGITPFGRWGSAPLVITLILFLAGGIGVRVAGFFKP